MNCPIDNTELLITDRQGIEIDYCPKCRGVWLDRGELDKLIERVAVAAPPAAPAPAPAAGRADYDRYDRGAPPPLDPRREYREHRDDDDDGYGRRDRGQPRRRRSVLDDIFDFD